jgi:hypothetical protein
MQHRFGLPRWEPMEIFGIEYEHQYEHELDELLNLRHLCITALIGFVFSD